MLQNWEENHRDMGRSKADAPCKKHRKHRQSPGVCSVCLSEKLVQLSESNGSSSSSKAARSLPSSSSSSSSISSLSSSDASSCSSPVVSYTCRVELEGRRPTRVFNKSRSMAFVSRQRKEDEDESGKKINGGFWSKLLPGRSRKLMHSKTMMIERPITAVH